MNRRICILILMILFTGGCGENKSEKRVIASVNEYKMTVEDFNYESEEILNIGKTLGEIPVSKREMLDALITKEVLIQEAAREDLDKEKDFMKTIELYWEQALLKNLLTGKSKEIAQKTVVYENEINRYYDKMKNRIKARIIVFLDKNSAEDGAECTDEALLAQEKDPQEYNISYVVASKWYTLGEDNSLLEYAVFDADIDKGKNVVKINGKWALVITEEVAPNAVEPLAPLSDELRERIRIIKEKEAMESWIDSLRSKTRIKINDKVFDSLD